MKMSHLNEALTALNAALQDLKTRIGTVQAAIDEVISDGDQEKSPHRQSAPPPPDHGHP